MLVAVAVKFGDPARTCVFMSRRELQALTQDSRHMLLQKRLRTTHTEQLQTDLETLRQELAAELHAKDESKEQLRAEMTETTRTHRIQVEEATRNREEEIRALLLGRQELS